VPLLKKPRRQTFLLGIATKFSPPLPSSVPPRAPPRALRQTGGSKGRRKSLALFSSFSPR
jgi:hypothetical protein